MNGYLKKKVVDFIGFKSTCTLRSDVGTISLSGLSLTNVFFSKPIGLKPIGMKPINWFFEGAWHSLTMTDFANNPEGKLNFTQKQKVCPYWPLVRGVGAFISIPLTQFESNDYLLGMFMSFLAATITRSILGVHIVVTATRQNRLKNICIRPPARPSHTAL